jgi:hypothetical protein
VFENIKAVPLDYLNDVLARNGDNCLAFGSVCASSRAASGSTTHAAFQQHGIGPRGEHRPIRALVADVKPARFAELQGYVSQKAAGVEAMMTNGGMMGHGMRGPMGGLQHQHLG